VGMRTGQASRPWMKSLRGSDRPGRGEMAGEGDRGVNVGWDARASGAGDAGSGDEMDSAACPRTWFYHKRN